MFESSWSRQSWNGRQMIWQCIPNIWSNRWKWFRGCHGCCHGGCHCGFTISSNAYVPRWWLLKIISKSFQIISKSFSTLLKYNFVTLRRISLISRIGSARFDANQTPPRRLLNTRDSGNRCCWVWWSPSGVTEEGLSSTWLIMDYNNNPLAVMKVFCPVATPSVLRCKSCQGRNFDCLAANLTPVG